MQTHSLAMSYYPINIDFFRAVFSHYKQFALYRTMDWPASQFLICCIRHLQVKRKKNHFRLSQFILIALSRQFTSLARYTLNFLLYIFTFFIFWWTCTILICIYHDAVWGDLMHFNIHTYEHKNKNISYWFTFPKWSWRSTVVAHSRFNKNVFIYWRFDNGAQGAKPFEILHEIT